MPRKVSPKRVRKTSPKRRGRPRKTSPRRKQRKTSPKRVRKTSPKRVRKTSPKRKRLNPPTRSRSYRAAIEDREEGKRQGMKDNRIVPHSNNNFSKRQQAIFDLLTKYHFSPYRYPNKEQARDLIKKDPDEAEVLAKEVLELEIRERRDASDIGSGYEYIPGMEYDESEDQFEEFLDNYGDD